VKELITNVAAKTLGKPYNAEAYLEALNNMHTAYCDMSSKLKSVVRDFIEIKSRYINRVSWH
jgi:hypothetical protein